MAGGLSKTTTPSIGKIAAAQQGWPPVAIQELQARFAADQKARAGVNPTTMTAEAAQQTESGMAKTDRDNTAWLQSNIGKYGWPTGAPANQAWLLAQHADHDPKFQAVVLEKMQAVSKNLQHPEHLSNVAYLTDRVAVNNKQPQLYGTQLNHQWDPVKNTFSNPTPHPISDAANLDARRKSMGMGPHVDYLKTRAPAAPAPTPTPQPAAPPASAPPPTPSGTVPKAPTAPMSSIKGVPGAVKSAAANAEDSK
jgi:hypothetical protein